MKSLAERTAIQQAYLDGKQIQVTVTGTWVDAQDPVFNWWDKDYRIKPAKKKVVYQALCNDNSGNTCWIPGMLFETEASAKDQHATFVRLLTDRPIEVEV